MTSSDDGGSGQDEQREDLAFGQESPSESEGDVSSGAEAEMVLRRTCKRKSLQSILEEAEADQADKGPKLGLFDLLCIGVGSTIGSGVFVLTGSVYPKVGPASVLSWIIAGLACLLSGLSYMELSSRLPTKGSCYVFAYHGLGEAAAVVGSLCLTLEYGMSGAGIARSWSEKVAAAIGGNAKEVMFIRYDSFGNSRTSTRYFDTPGSNGTLPQAAPSSAGDSYLDWVALAIMAASVIVTAVGLSLGKVVINGFTVAKVLLVMFLIVNGFSLWNYNPFSSWEEFNPAGTGGILQGATSLFFGFIGFDEVCCLASKAKDPAKLMPRAIAGTLIGATILSGSAQLALSGAKHYALGMEETSFEKIFSERGLGTVRWITTIGEIVLLPLVVYLSFLPQPELMAAMAEDQLLPSIFCRKNKQGTYVAGSLISGTFMMLAALAVPFSVLWDVISLGVLIGFNLTNASLIQVRYGNGGMSRNPKISRMVWGLLASTLLAGYGIWLGYAADALKGKPPSAFVSTLGFGFLAVTIGLVAYIAHTGEQIQDADSSSFYKVVGVPWVPSAGMLVNAFMMASISFNSHVFLLALLVLFFAMYLAYKFTRNAKQSHKHPES